jgi:hypothetical protein
VFYEVPPGYLDHIFIPNREMKGLTSGRGIELLAQKRKQRWTADM